MTCIKLEIHYPGGRLSNIIKVGVDAISIECIDRLKYKVVFNNGKRKYFSGFGFESTYEDKEE